jgi:hypothetical protein
MGFLRACFFPGEAKKGEGMYLAFLVIGSNKTIKGLWTGMVEVQIPPTNV